MARDSKAARAVCAIAFKKILLKIIGYPTKISSWENLLAFGPSVLAKSSRGGATRDQANIVFKRFCECNKTPALHSIHTRPTRIVSNKKQNSILQQQWQASCDRQFPSSNPVALLSGQTGPKQLTTTPTTTTTTTNTTTTTTTTTTARVCVRVCVCVCLCVCVLTTILHYT